MESKVIKVRVADSETKEENITDYMLATTTVFSKDRMVKYLKMAPDTFYLRADGSKVKLEVAKNTEGVVIIKSVGDSTPSNNLLSLPKF